MLFAPCYATRDQKSAVRRQRDPCSLPIAPCSLPVARCFQLFEIRNLSRNCLLELPSGRLIGNLDAHLDYEILNLRLVECFGRLAERDDLLAQHQRGYRSNGLGQLGRHDAQKFLGIVHFLFG